VTLYDELGVEPGASPEELHRAYRARARQVHPDAIGDGDGQTGAANEAMASLNRTWAVLGDPTRRARYDATLGGGRVPAMFPSSFRMAPWIAMAVVMALIFVMTAYANHPRGGGSPGVRPQPSPTSTALPSGSPRR
jgi:curved DNA-binding protein CbpA